MFAVTAKRALANAARNATVPAAGPAHGWLAADLGAVASTASRGAGVSTWAAARAALAAEAGVSALGAFADADAALEGGLLPYARSREARDSDARVAPGEATDEARRRDAPTALFGWD